MVKGLTGYGLHGYSLFLSVFNEIFLFLCVFKSYYNKKEREKKSEFVLPNRLLGTLHPWIMMHDQGNSYWKDCDA